MVTCNSVCNGARRITRTVTRRLDGRKVHGVIVRGISRADRSFVVTSMFGCGKLVIKYPACGARVCPRVRTLLDGLTSHRVGKHCLKCFNSFA